MIQRLRTDEIYECSDLAISAYLALWYPIEAIDRTNPQKARFIFKRDKQMDKLIELFWRGQAQVNPLAYFNALKNVKARLYEERQY